MNARIVLAGVVLILGGALGPASAQDQPARPPEAPQNEEKYLDERPSVPARPSVRRSPEAQNEEKYLDELDEARVREEVLKMDLQNTKMQLQQWMQMANQMRFGGLQASDSATEEARRQRDEALKKIMQGRDEMTSSYMAVTRELSRTSRRRAELEKRLSTQAGERVVKEKAAKHRAGHLLKVGGMYINARQISYVTTAKDEKGVSTVRVHLVEAGTVLTLKGEAADSAIESLERHSR